MRSLIFLLALTSLALAASQLTAPFNSCPHLQIGTIQMTNYPAGSNFSFIAATVPLNVTQPNNTYQLAASIQQLEMSQSQSRIQVGIGFNILSPSSINIRIFGMHSGQYVTLFKVTYLVIPFDYSNIFSIFFIVSDPIDQEIQPGETFYKIKQFPKTLNTGLNSAMVFFVDLDMSSNEALPSFGLSFGLEIINNTNYLLTITNIAPTNVTYFFFDRCIIVVNHPSIPYASSIFMFSITSPSASYSYEAITVSNTFYGMGGILVANKVKYMYSIMNGSASVTKGDDVLYLKVNFIVINIFDNGKCCGKTPFIDIINQRCTQTCSGNMTSQDCALCNNGTLYNTTTKECQSCPLNSYLNSSNACQSCPLNSYLNSSNACQSCPLNSSLSTNGSCICHTNFAQINSSCVFQANNTLTSTPSSSSESNYLNFFGYGIIVGVSAALLILGVIIFIKFSASKVKPVEDKTFINISQIKITEFEQMDQINVNKTTEQFKRPQDQTRSKGNNLNLKQQSENIKINTQTNHQHPLEFEDLK